MFVLSNYFKWFLHAVCKSVTNRSWLVHIEMGYLNQAFYFKRDPCVTGIVNFVEICQSMRQR